MSEQSRSIRYAILYEPCKCDTLGSAHETAHTASVDTAKDTQRALVRLTYDGKVIKLFRGPKAEERFTNEVKVLRYLGEAGCPFVPRLIEVDPAKLQIVTTSCGSRVERLDEARTRELFEELERDYGVKHDDPDMRNVTYRQQDGRFCLIDFEFATILRGEQAGGFMQEDVRK